jgi:hypothetical protein
VEYAAVTDVADRYEGTIPPERYPWVATLIVDATSLLRGKLPQLDTWVTTGQVPVSEARRVVAEVVLRRFRNPGGYRQETEGPYGSTRDATSASGRLVVLDEELAALTPPGDTPAGVGTALLGIPGWRVP